MTDRETSLIERWRSERDMYRAWGDYVAELLSTAVGQKIAPVSLELFFRIPIKPRLKEEGSLLAKAFYRDKNYANPYDEIEDKIGIRVVVLYSEEIRLVESEILTEKHWSATKARDFEEERNLRPFEFDYQSLHYVVRANSGNIYRGVTIADGTPCEIQVRTILQHAYSELTHDTIYKPTVKAEPGVKRAAAKSMALIEATDDYFAHVRSRIEAALEPGRKVTAVTLRLYRDLIAATPDPSPLNTQMIDFFRQWAREGFEDDLRSFYEQKAFLLANIAERAPTNLLYRQPSILLAYWAITKAPRAVAEKGPLSNRELAPLYGDLGLRLPESAA